MLNKIKEERVEKLLNDYMRESMSKDRVKELNGRLAAIYDITAIVILHLEDKGIKGLEQAHHPLLTTLYKIEDEYVRELKL